MAPSLRCPQCSTVLSAEPGKDAVCPSCGFTAPVPLAATAPAQVGVGVEAGPGAPGAPVLTPLPAGAEVPAWARRGKVVHPAVVVLLVLVTLGIYAIVYWWRVSKETDLLRGHRHAHGVLKVGVILAVVGLVVAIVAVAAGAAVAYGIGSAAEQRYQSEEEFIQELVEAALPFAMAALLAFVLYLVGLVMVMVAQYRSWDTLRSAERAASGESTINPGLYLFLPLGLMLASPIPGPAGLLLGIGGYALVLTFMAITQAHLNRIWATMASAPAPAPEAR
jgi:hypothetical protein